MLKDEQQSEPERLLETRLVAAIQHRQAQGLETTLRDLHRLLEVSQPVALRLARRLERKGIADIEPNMIDGFASVIRIRRSVRVETGLRTQRF